MTPQLRCDKESPYPRAFPLCAPDNDPMKLTKTLLFLFELTNLALPWEPQSIPPMDSNKGMCPQSYHISDCTPPWPPAVAPGGMPGTSSRTGAPHTSLFQFPCGLRLTLWPTIGTLGLFLTKVHLTKSHDFILHLISSFLISLFIRLAPIISVNIKKK